jgi:hypothetical protein
MVSSTSKPCAVCLRFSIWGDLLGPHLSDGCVRASLILHVDHVPTLTPYVLRLALKPKYSSVPWPAKCIGVQGKLFIALSEVSQAV